MALARIIRIPENESVAVVANGGEAITDPDFPRPVGQLVIWPMANGVTPNNAVWPDLINTADA